MIFLPATVLLGYLDWQHSYGGEWLGPIKVKIVTAAVLLVVLIPAQWAYHRRWSWTAVLLLQIAALLCVVVLGFAGGQLMY